MQTIFGHFWPFLVFSAIFEKHSAHLKPLAPARITYDNFSDIQDATRGFLQKMLIQLKTTTTTNSQKIINMLSNKLL